jgi:hypothetical protein
MFSSPLRWDRSLRCNTDVAEEFLFFFTKAMFYSER